MEGEFGYSKRHANRLIAAQGTRDKLGPIGPTEALDGGEVPESHARELGRLRDDQRADCYADYIDECEQQKTKPTAAGLREKVETWLADNEPYVDVGDDEADDEADDRLRDDDDGDQGHGDDGGDQLREDDDQLRVHDGGDQVGPADPQHDDGHVVDFDVTAESAAAEERIRRMFHGWPAEHRQFIPGILQALLLEDPTEW